MGGSLKQQGASRAAAVACGYMQSPPQLSGMRLRHARAYHMIRKPAVQGVVVAVLQHAMAQRTMPQKLASSAHSQEPALYNGGDGQSVRQPACMAGSAGSGKQQQYGQVQPHIATPALPYP